MNKEELLHKIIQGEITPEEEVNLFNTPSSLQRQQKEWNLAGKTDFEDTIDETKSFENIKHHIWGREQILPFRFKVYVAAASILVCTFLGSTLWFYGKSQMTPEKVYVLTNGHQGIEQIMLADGTNVLLGPESKLIYPKVFNDDERKVELVGQAFFEVAKNPQKPFIVKTPQMEVTALGTAFEIFAFEGEKVCETILLNGKIKVTMPNAHNETNREGIILLPDQKLTITNTGAVNVEKVDANTYSSWRNHGSLCFVNEKLSMIIPRIEKWYGRKILYDKDVADSYRFSLTIEDEPLDEMMHIIDRISSLTVKKEKNCYLITKNP